MSSDVTWFRPGLNLLQSGLSEPQFRLGFGQGCLTQAFIVEDGDSGTSFIGTAGFVSGSFGEITAVPEPGTIAAGLVIVGFIAWRERKRLASIVRRSTKSAVIS